MERFLKFLQRVANAFKAPIKNAIESEALALCLLKFPFIPKFITKIVVRWTLSKTVNPAIDAAYRELNFQIEVVNGNILLKKINNDSNVDDWNNDSNGV